MDLPSINFEHFIETTKQQENISQPRKRVCIVTDQPLTKNLYEQVDNISDFTDLNFYQNLTNSPGECRKPTPPGKNLDCDR